MKINEILVEAELPLSKRSLEFRRWFGASKVVDKNGDPLVMYHGTGKDFSEFNPYSHFGSQDAANFRLTTAGGDRVMPVYLSIKNPIRTPDFKDWEGEFIDYVYQKKFLTPAQYSATESEVQQFFNQDENATMRHDDLMKIVIPKLKVNGYDGIVYNNDWEGGGDSWLAFDPNQIKSIYNKTPTDSSNINR